MTLSTFSKNGSAVRGNTSIDPGQNPEPTRVADWAREHLPQDDARLVDAFAAEAELSHEWAHLSMGLAAETWPKD